MNVPLRWLADFVDTGLSARELAHKLTMAGLEAEQIQEIGAGWNNVFVGDVKSVERHPNADRLVLADVEAGPHHLTVVTGAPNIAAGQKVALALAGARLIDGHSDSGALKTLKPGMIRGIRSEGMVCSEKELGISNEHEGILVLEPEAPVGAPLAEWLGDTVIEFEITPNLVHAFSILGIAREAAAITERPLQIPATVDPAALPTSERTFVEIAAPDLCRRYTGIIIDGITIGPSPAWLARRLTAAGVRPVNNVVDVTNYVMLEWGQPLHAFDLSLLQGEQVIVRRAAPGETIETLDHQQRELSPEMLVIADAAHPVAIAGVMGGVESEVDANTTKILLESANFDMKSVRHTARILKLHTDASARFERGLDPALAGPAAARATRLLLDLCPASRVVAAQDVYPEPVQPWHISLPVSLIERVLGISYPNDTVVDVLMRLEFAPVIEQQDGNEILTVTVPTYRRDVTIPQDVVEEVARIVGYDSLPETLPVGGSSPVLRDPIFLLQWAVRESLTAAGCFEAVTRVNLGRDQLQRLDPSEPEIGGFLYREPIADLLTLRNPIPADRPLLRPTLLPAMLEALAENLKHETSARLFELSRIYLPRGRDTLPNERNVLGIVLAGAREPLSRFTQAGGELDYFDLKGTVELTLARLSVPAVTYQPAASGTLHPGRAAELILGETRIGLLGELHPDVAAAFGIESGRVCVAELDLDLILAHRPAQPPSVNVPHYLPVQQDFAIVVAETTPAEEVQEALQLGAGPLATEIVLFDIYRGAPLAPETKSLAYRVTFTAPDRALTDAELNKVRPRIERSLKQRVAGTLRV